MSLPDSRYAPFRYLVNEIVRRAPSAVSHLRIPVGSGPCRVGCRGRACRAPPRVLLHVDAMVSNASDHEHDPQSGSLGPIPFLAFAALWSVTTLAILLVQYPEVLQGAQTDTDGYMRLVRVRRLLEEGGWFDGSVPRLNWPQGEVLHWTRPLDLILVALAGLARPFAAPGTELVVAGAIVSPLLHLGLCLSAPWVVRPLVPGPARYLAMLTVLPQMGVIGYGNPGRADHHVLVFLLVFLAMGWWLRALHAPDRPRAPMLAGLAMALAVWVSPEGLLALGVFFLSGAASWLLDGRRFVPANRRLAAGLLVGLALGLVVERPPWGWLAVEYDRLSVAHLAMAFVALAFWLVAGRLGEARESGPGLTAGWITRLGVAGVGGVAALLLLRTFFPGFFQGPWAEADPALLHFWVSRTPELQPLWPSSTSRIGPFLMHLLPALVVLPAVALWAWRDVDRGRRHLWLFLVVGFVVLLPMAMAQVRLSGYQGLFAAAAMTELARRAASAAERWSRGTRTRSLARAGAMATVLLGPLAVSVAAAAALSPEATGARSRSDDGGSCALRVVLPVLDDPAGFGASPRTVLTYLTFGPELLFRSEHRVLAGPYHRNTEGIRAVLDFLAAEDPEVSRGIARDREVELVLLCPPLDGSALAFAPATSLYHRMLGGDLPGWLREIPLPMADLDGFRLLEVVDTGAVPAGGGRETPAQDLQHLAHPDDAR